MTTVTISGAYIEAALVRAGVAERSDNKAHLKADSIRLARAGFNSVMVEYRFKGEVIGSFVVGGVSIDGELTLEGVDMRMQMSVQ